MMRVRVGRCMLLDVWGLSKNRRDDGTGRSLPPAASRHIVALVTRRGGQRDSNYCQLNETLVVGATGQT